MAATIVDPVSNGLKTYEDNGDHTGAQHVIVDSAASVTPQATATGENHIGSVGGEESLVNVEVTRPANVTAYAAKDVIAADPAAILSFTNLARANGKGGYIVKARLVTDDATNTAEYRLYLYHTTPSAINDNAPYTLLYADKDKLIGYIDFSAMTSQGTGSTSAESQVNDVRLKFSVGGASRTVLGILTAKTAFTPVSGQKFFIELASDLN